MGDTERKTGARIAISKDRRDELRAAKRGGETYDQLLRKMVEQYDPEEADPEA
jgi:hypothetical protein